MMVRIVHDMQESLVLAALRAAIALRQPKPGLIHHTDRGGQYAGGEYRKMLGRARMVQSMSRADDCSTRKARLRRSAPPGAQLHQRQAAIFILERA